MKQPYVRQELSQLFHKKISLADLKPKRMEHVLQHKIIEEIRVNESC